MRMLQNYTLYIIISELYKCVAQYYCMYFIDDNGPYYTGQIRLRGGDYPSEGRVELYVYGVWSSLYASSSTSRRYADDANVICKQLGYTGADYHDVGILLVVR